ncbi:MAG TPA: hypothetical protein VFB38_16305 [Chthonomonadaceae bacterium]|nr:hypothetical protein [Chthonomonadaceae bacterium]
MILTLDLDPKLESQLCEQAAAKGVELEAYVKELLKTAAQRERNQAAIAALRSWREEGDEEEQRETFEALKRGLNESRRGYRVLFPEDGEEQA